MSNRLSHSIKQTMPGAIMKSLIRWGAALGIAGSAVLSSTGIGNMGALALPEKEILQKLGPVPVFTITDNKGAPLVASEPNQKNQPGVAGVFINHQDAEAFVQQLKKKDPKLAQAVRVVPVSLGEVYKLEQTNQNKPNSLDFAYVPAKQQVDAAMALMNQTGQDAKKFSGTPLFVAKAGKAQGNEKGYLTIKQAEQQVIPFFFNKEELQSMLEKFKQQKPDLASTVEIQVVNLEGIIKTLETGKDKDLNQIVLVPPRESIQYVRQLESTAPGQNQKQPAAAPAKKP